MQPKPSARLLSAQHPSYASFVTEHRDRDKVLWAAAGDGMLHAFKAADGESIMSYVPEALVPRLNELATGSSVQAFVDGSLFTADVDTNAGVSAGTNWRTYVFGSLGRGGRGIFALDATNLTSLATAESHAASIFKWQLNADDDPDLGHLLGDISIEPGTGQAAPVVKLQDGRFALVFGNGYGSREGKAVLFIVPVQGPNSAGSWSGRYYKVVLDSGTGNGLSTATPLDTNNDDRADTVYAGDLKGNLWKINIGSTSPGDWGSAYQSGGQCKPAVRGHRGGWDDAAADHRCAAVFLPQYRRHDGELRHWFVGAVHRLSQGLGEPAGLWRLGPPGVRGRHAGVAARHRHPGCQDAEPAAERQRGRLERRGPQPG